MTLNIPVEWIFIILAAIIYVYTIFKYYCLQSDHRTTLNHAKYMATMIRKRGWQIKAECDDGSIVDITDLYFDPHDNSKYVYLDESDKKE